jgi:hypothetical protein
LGSNYDVLALVQALIHECSDDADLRELLGKVGSTFGTGNEVQEEDAVFGHTLGLEDFDRHERGTT